MQIGRTLLKVINTSDENFLKINSVKK